MPHDFHRIHSLVAHGCPSVSAEFRARNSLSLPTEINSSKYAIPIDRPASDMRSTCATKRRFSHAPALIVPADRKRTSWHRGASDYARAVACRRRLHVEHFARTVEEEFHARESRERSLEEAAESHLQRVKVCSGGECIVLIRLQFRQILQNVGRPVRRMHRWCASPAR